MARDVSVSGPTSLAKTAKRAKGFRSSYTNIWADAQNQLGYSQAVHVDNTLYIAGTASLDENFRPIHVGDFRAQLQLVYERIGETLQHFGLDFPQVVREVIYVTDMTALAAAMDLRKGFYGNGPFPVATGVEVRALFFPELMVEIETIAAFPT